MDIEQAIWNDTGETWTDPRKSPSMSKKNNFLTGASELKKLNRLKEMTLEVSNVYLWAAVSLHTERESLWWKDDMQKWAQNMKAEILGGEKEFRRA